MSFGTITAIYPAPAASGSGSGSGGPQAQLEVSGTSYGILVKTSDAVQIAPQLRPLALPQMPDYGIIIKHQAVQVAPPSPTLDIEIGQNYT